MATTPPQMSRRQPAAARAGVACPVRRASPIDDPTEERIEAEIVAHLFRGAAPEAYRQAVAQRGALRAEKAALQREAAETRAQTRRLAAYTDLLTTDVSGYSEAELEEYRRELQRRSNQCFGSVNNKNE